MARLKFEYIDIETFFKPHVSLAFLYHTKLFVYGKYNINVELQIVESISLSGTCF